MTKPQSVTIDDAQELAEYLTREGVKRGKEIETPKNE